MNKRTQGIHTIEEAAKDIVKAAVRWVSSKSNFSNERVRLGKDNMTQGTKMIILGKLTADVIRAEQNLYECVLVLRSLSEDSPDKSIDSDKNLAMS